MPVMIFGSGLVSSPVCKIIAITLLISSNYTALSWDVIFHICLVYFCTQLCPFFWLKKKKKEPLEAFVTQVVMEICLILSEH